MLTSLVLPPLLPASPPPVATFFNIPRRYVKSNMQIGNDTSHSPMDVDFGRQLRKSSRILEARTTPTLSPVQHTKEEAPRKRIASFDVGVNGAGSVDGDSPTDSRVPTGAPSAGSGELSGHVCLCQPEPKIPRPRNGKSIFSVYPRNRLPEPSPSTRTKKLVFVCDRPCQPLILCSFHSLSPASPTCHRFQ